MKKEEIIHLHMLLAQLKEFCEQNGLACDFVRYESLGISPFQVHRSKEEHKQAIFVLLSEIVSAMTRKNSQLPELIQNIRK